MFLDEVLRWFEPEDRSGRARLSAQNLDINMSVGCLMICNYLATDL